MSNPLFTTVSIAEQQTIIGGASRRNLNLLNNIKVQGRNNVVVVVNNITIINMIFNFFIYPPRRRRKRCSCKF
jgi:hypothetical protein